MSLLFISSVPNGLVNAQARHISASSVRAGRSGAFVSRKQLARYAAPQHNSSLRMAATEPPKKPTAREMTTLYSSSYLVTSAGLSIISFGVFYFLIYVGIDLRALLNALGDWFATTPLGRPSVLDDISDSAGTAALAYIAHKATSPLRFPVTIAATPLVAKVLKKEGDTEESS